MAEIRKITYCVHPFFGAGKYFPYAPWPMRSKLSDAYMRGLFDLYKERIERISKEESSIMLLSNSFSVFKDLQPRYSVKMQKEFATYASSVLNPGENFFEVAYNKGVICTEPDGSGRPLFSVVAEQGHKISTDILDVEVFGEISISCVSVGTECIDNDLSHVLPNNAKFTVTVNNSFCGDRVRDVVSAHPEFFAEHYREFVQNSPPGSGSPYIFAKQGLLAEFSLKLSLAWKALYSAISHSRAEADVSN